MEEVLENYAGDLKGEMRWNWRGGPEEKIHSFS